MENYFAELNRIDVGEHIEKKNGLSYLAWAWAWGELKKRHPTAYYTVYEDARGCIYHTDGKTCWVKTGVSVEISDGRWVEHIEYLPVMDFRNQSISAEKVTSMDVNKAIQRSLTKAVARHGLGLYIYAGEDLPDDDGDGLKPARSAKPAEAPKMASEAQRKVLAQVLEPVQYAAMQAKYGANLERLTAEMAGKALAKAKEGGAA